MRIAFSCAGEGFGHATRLVALGPLLEKRHEVFYFVPPTVRTYVRSRLGSGKIRPIPHFAFVKKGDSVRLFASAFRALPRLGSFPFAVLGIVRRLRKLRVEAVLSDFDPYLAWAAWLVGIPVLQINHPGVLQRLPAPDPRSRLAGLGSRLMEGPWNERIHISFFYGDLGPIIRPELLLPPRRDEGFILAYLKPAYRDETLPILDGLAIPYRLYPGHSEDFASSLASCSCVLASAGHQIISEALALGKPMLAIPQRGQWEQRVNAEMLVATGRGERTSLRELERDLPRFLAELDRYRRAVPIGCFRTEDATAAVLARVEAFLAAVGKKGFMPAAKALRDFLEGLAA